MTPAGGAGHAEAVCLHCGYALRRTTGAKGTVWVHKRGGEERCRPTYAAPVVPGDPAWHEPLDVIMPGERPIEEMGLTGRPYNRLKHEGIHTVGELASRSEYDLLDIRSFGGVSLGEVKAKLASMGLTLKANPPTVSGVTPNTGPAHTAVTIAGTWFRPGTVVTFGGVPAVGVDVVSDTEIRCAVPAGVKDRHVTVQVTADGTAMWAHPFTVQALNEQET